MDELYNNNVVITLQGRKGLNTDKQSIRIFYKLTSCLKNSEGVMSVNFLKELLNADLE